MDYITGERTHTHQQLAAERLMGGEKMYKNTTMCQDKMAQTQSQTQSVGKPRPASASKAAQAKDHLVGLSNTFRGSSAYGTHTSFLVAGVGGRIGPQDHQGIFHSMVDHILYLQT